MTDDPSLDERTLDQLQRAAFGYFLEEVNPSNGLVADTSREGSPCSIGVVRFALSVYPVAVERGWMTRGPSSGTSRCFNEVAPRGTRKVVPFMLGAMAVFPLQ